MKLRPLLSGVLITPMLVLFGLGTLAMFAEPSSISDKIEVVGILGGIIVLTYIVYHRLWRRGRDSRESFEFGVVPLGGLSTVVTIVFLGLVNNLDVLVVAAIFCLSAVLLVLPELVGPNWEA